MVEDIEDPTNLIGLGSLVNPKHTNKNLNLEVIEKQFMSKGGIKKIPEYDPDKEFNRTINAITSKKSMGRNGVSHQPKQYEKPAYEKPTYEDRNQSDKYNNEDEYNDNNGNNEDEPVYDETNEAEYEQPGDEAELLQEEGAEEGNGDEIDINEEPEDIYSKYQYTGGTRKPAPKMNNTNVPQYYANYAASSNTRNNSGSTANNFNPDDYIGGAIRDYAGDDVNFEKEAEEEEKAVLLEDIDELRFELEGEGLDLSRIPVVDTATPLNVVRKIHKMLRMKYDRKRCNGFGTGLIMAGAQGLEYVFDGKRKYGPYSPDLTGWHNTIRPKLRRMRYETSTIVANIMHDYNIGPLARVFLELVPSAFLYSKMRRDQHGRSNYTPDQMSEAYEDLRQFDND